MYMFKYNSLINWNMIVEHKTNIDLTFSLNNVID